ncbi:SGNH/GDSL hydrolase family protein [Enterococcus sp. DIV0242_7C1]|uniref:SGNH hydrolase-type esterase domain-containing protein n=1 Tax=Candidatus Enterococcus dunnyi TaxID=1834192 RepID=A0A200JDG7_9ENTE|nr:MULTISPECIES: SGNH/GDSL hydrolase family protein [unclassified Enterococcus]MBO0471846.1 SGNH/GDSL hydrolase family protein [Enterococcus sp. DIV0242_7C1]OUZ34720.1 hypothetical protein A5889_000195 [Enterococcus sp. 9D6_DIV0238]
MKKISYALAGATVPIIIFILYFFFAANPAKEKTMEAAESSTFETNESTSTTNEVSTSLPEKLVYAPMGDSLSAGWIVEKEDEKFTSVLATKLSEEFDINIDQKGIFKAGEKASGLGISSIEDIKEQKPDLVTVEYGTNDILAYKDDQSLLQFEANISHIVTELQAEHIFIVLVTTWNRDQKLSQRYDDVLFKVGAKYGVPVANIRGLWTTQTDTIDPKKYPNIIDRKELDKDMHPNTKGHEEIAQRIFQTIERPFSEYLNEKYGLSK